MPRGSCRIPQRRLAACTGMTCAMPVKGTHSRTTRAAPRKWYGRLSFILFYVSFSVLSFYRFQPGMRHETGTGHGGMDAVYRPVPSGRQFKRLVVDALIGNEGRFKLLGDLPGGLPVSVKSREPGFVH